MYFIQVDSKGSTYTKTNFESVEDAEKYIALNYPDANYWLIKKMETSGTEEDKNDE